MTYTRSTTGYLRSGTKAARTTRRNPGRRRRARRNPETGRERVAFAFSEAKAREIAQRFKAKTGRGGVIRKETMNQRPCWVIYADARGGAVALAAESPATAYRVTRLTKPKRKIEVVGGISRRQLVDYAHKQLKRYKRLNFDKIGKVHALVYAKLSGARPEDTPDLGTPGSKLAGAVLKQALDEHPYDIVELDVADDAPMSAIIDAQVAADQLRYVLSNPRGKKRVSKRRAKKVRHARSKAKRHAREWRAYVADHSHRMGKRPRRNPDDKERSYPIGVTGSLSSLSSLSALNQRIAAINNPRSSTIIRGHVVERRRRGKGIVYSIPAYGVSFTTRKAVDAYLRRHAAASRH